MKPKLIKTGEEHAAALARVEALMDARPGSPQEDELELWSLLVEQYEKEHYPIDDPDPIEAIRFRMDQLGLQQKDLVAYIGTKSKVSEVLNRKRPLSLPMIRGLHGYLGISAATLVREPPAAPKGKAGRERRAADESRTKPVPATKPLSKNAARPPSGRARSGHL